MALAESAVDSSSIRDLVRKENTHRQIFDTLKEIYPGKTRFSETSICRLCSKYEIRKLTDDEIDGIVWRMIMSYGHFYGRAMMQGAIRSQYGTSLGCVSQRWISKSWQRVAPIEFGARRRDILEKANPIPYYAPYFGYKIHMDQNEKLQCYGCTHVVMIDGCPQMVCGFGTMEIKNPIVIYDKIFRPAIAKYGIWNQLHIDHGK